MTWEKGGLIWLWLTHLHHCSSLKSGQELKQGRNLEAGADAEAMGGGGLLSCLLFIASSACFSVEPRTTYPGVATPTMAQFFPHQLLIKKMPSETCLLANLMEAIPQLRFFFPDNYSLCQVDKNKQTIIPWYILVSLWIVGKISGYK